MIIKFFPEDFFVKEVIEFPEKNGKYAYYLMKKKNLTTIRAIKIVAKYFMVSKKRIKFAGEKDKKAVTEQYISIKDLDKIKEKVKIKGIELKYIGKFKEPVSLKLLKGNEFRIVVRDLSDEDVSKMSENLSIIKDNGFVNYFDDQRFGDVRCNNHLIGKAILKRDYEEAIKILLTFYSENENKLAKKARKIAEENWGDWKTIIREFPRWLDVELAILNYLVKNPNDFKGALLQLHKKLIKLFINAYQSYLFNKALSNFLKRACRNYKTIKVCSEELAVPPSFENLDIKEFPIVGYKTNLKEYPEPVKEVYEEILLEEDIDLKFFKFKDKKLKFLSSEGGKRSVFVVPKNLKYSVEDDDVFEGKKKIIFSFYLPKGSYATMLVKQVFA